MRLDHYVKIGDNNIHLASIIYSLALIIGLVGIISQFLARSVKKDFEVLEVIQIRRRELRQERLKFVAGTDEDQA